MAELLNGSHFNYVMLSPIGDPARSQGAPNSARQGRRSSLHGPAAAAPNLPAAHADLSRSPGPAAKRGREESPDNGDAADENADNQNQDQTDNQPETQDGAQAVQGPSNPQASKPQNSSCKNSASSNSR